MSDENLRLIDKPRHQDEFCDRKGWELRNSKERKLLKCNFFKREC